MLGSRFKIACACFLIPYWYIFLLDKSYWNNHTYLYGIIVILLWGTGADKYLWVVKLIRITTIIMVSMIEEMEKILSLI